MRVAFRFPGVLEAASELVQRLRNPELPSGISVAPWIEPTLREVLTETPSSKPVFTVVHLNDAHEPYYRSAGVSGDEASDQPPMVRQDYMRCIEGDWMPSGTELATLHTLYCAVIRSLDRRMEGLVKEVSNLRDIDRALVIVTADHGQAFGEGGWLFHMYSSEEALLRIPLIVRFPGAAHSGKGVGWASTVDIFPTVLAACRFPPPRSGSAYALQALSEEKRRGPTWALGDGLPLHHLEDIVSIPSVLRKGLAPRYWLAAYEGNHKLVYDFSSGEFHEFLIEVLRGSETRCSESDFLESRPHIRSEAMRLATEILARRHGTASETVAQRLDSWGYGA